MVLAVLPGHPRAAECVAEHVVQGAAQVELDLIISVGPGEIGDVAGEHGAHLAAGGLHGGLAGDLDHHTSLAGTTLRRA